MFSVLLSDMSAWTDEEVVKLIEIWGEGTIQAQLEGCKQRGVHEGIKGNEGGGLRKEP